MSQITREFRMKKVLIKRLRRPCKSTAEVRYEVVRRKSQAGIEYISYKPIILIKKNV